MFNPDSACELLSLEPQVKQASVSYYGTPNSHVIYVAGYGARLIYTYLASLVHVEWHKRSFERFAMLHPTPIKTLNYCTRHASHPSGLEAGPIGNVHDLVDSASWRTWS